MSQPFPLPTLWRSVRRSATRSFRGLGELIFPWHCVVCESSSREGPLCSECRTEFEASVARYASSACHKCAMPCGPYGNKHGSCSTCRRRKFRFDAALALGTYDNSLRTLCLRLKHENSAWLAPRLGAVLADLRIQQPGPDGYKLSIPPEAWVVPVPLHWKRRWKRRYNQAEAIAQGIADRLGLRIRRSLKRVVATPSLAEQGMSPTERLKVMRGAFVAREDPRLKGRTIVLVDDVLTTGATSSEAARVLKKAGASRVICAVLARAEGLHL